MPDYEEADESWEAVVDASYPRTAKFYAINAASEEEYAQDVPALVRLIYERLRVDIPVVRERALQRDLRLRTAHYVFRRVVRLGAFLARREKSVSSDSFINAYRDQLHQLLDLDADAFPSVFFLARRIIDYLWHQQGGLSSAQIRHVRRVARENSHNCIFCGTSLSFDSDGEENSFEIEHLIAQSLGGTKHPTNLVAACKRCNKLKADRLSFVDIYYETFGIISEQEGLISPHQYPHILLGLFMRQQGRCFHCQRPFYVIAPETVVLARRELDDYYHFRNCYIACRECAEKGQIEGVEVPVPVPRKRES